MNDRITNPYDVVPLISKYSKKRQEHFGLICLDSECKVISNKVMFVGSEHKSLVDGKMLFWEACTKKASAIIVYHNHPSQCTSPSDLDINLTKKIDEASNILGIQLLDHLIIGKYDYFSFLEHDLVLSTKQESKVAENV